MSRTTFRGGVHPNDCKKYSKDAPFEVLLPKNEVVLPLNQHIGKPAQPVVAKGDPVRMGQLIAQADGFISANVHSSCSGTVKAIELRRNVLGVMVQSIVIDNDGKFTPDPGIGSDRNYDKMTNQEIIDAVKWAGVVGLGGAGFPTNVKLLPKNPEEIKYIIANGAECEPFITCDDQLMRCHAPEIVEGMKIMLRLFPTAKGVILIEQNKPEAIAAMKKACEGTPNIEVLAAETKYPQGGERSCISLVAGKHLKLGMLPADVGCIVDNVATVYAIYRAVCKTEPLYEKTITVTGDAVKEPKNLIVKIGTSFEELVEFAGGIKDEIRLKKALCGGPMMGFSLAELSTPVLKNNNALTLLTYDDVEDAQKQMTTCLRCGRCNNVCPLGLVPQMMAVAAEKRNYERYEKKLYGMECIQCGSCTYVCPAKRPLMQLFKHAKAEITAAKKQQGGGK
ncbi:MAG: electron transport complex subunit RsxC [Blautia sp.]|nr:electron transport complex subunit RsxC [Blautia sp.]